MENEEKIETPVPAPAPTADACDRLTAARKYACEQYEKLRAVAVEQMDRVRGYTAQARKQVNEGWDSYAGKYIRLENNIDMEQNNWIPVGYDKNYPFEGVSVR